MTLEELKAALKVGEVKFKFTKKDGTIREARGTTCPDLLPKVEPKEGEEDKPKKVIKLSQNVTRYYDLDKEQWRSFINESLITEEQTQSPE